MARKRSAGKSSDDPKNSKVQKVDTEDTKTKNKTETKIGDAGPVIKTFCGGPFTLTSPEPTRNNKGELIFKDEPEFRPNMTPKEVLQAGSFGGTYFRPIKSGVTGESYTGVWKELPKDWLEGLNISTQVAAKVYDAKVNKYGVKCGGSLEMWEQSGWMHKEDPYGWFMWYCRYYQGRRMEDDDRQIGRWQRCAGLKGRWRQNLVSKIVRSGCTFDNLGVSPVVRQTLLHWGYSLTKDDFDKGAKRVKV